MTLKPARKRNIAQRGLSLFEMLLVVGVAATFFIFLTNIGRTIAEKQAIESAANYVKQIDNAVADMLRAPDRFNILYNTLVLSGGVGQATIAQLRAGTGIFGALPPTPVLGATFPAAGPYNQTFIVIFRIADNLALATDNRVIEAFIASETLIEDRLALSISAAMGGMGGALRDSPAIIGSTMRSAFNIWNAPTDNLAVTNWYATVNASATPPLIENGAYVVAYHYYDLERVAKDYVYRRDMGDPELNRVYGNLGMSGYNVLGVDNINAAGRLTGAEMAVQGSASLGSTRVNGNFQADAPAVATGNVTAASGSLSVPGGTLSVSGTITTGSALFSDTLNTANLTTVGMTSDVLTLNNGSLNTSQVNMTNAGVGAAGLTAPGVTVTGGLSASSVNNNNLTVSTGRTGMLFLQTSGTYNQTAGTTSARRYTSGARTRVGNNDWRCGSGC